MTDSDEPGCMVAQGIEYVELYVTDQSAVLDYYLNSLGFTEVATASQDGLTSVLLREGKVQLIVTAGPGAAGFLDKHGDGIADIPLSCDDVAAAADRAARAGARVRSTPAGYPIVTGFGDVSHTLLPTPPSDVPRLPPGHAWTVSPTAPIVPDGRIRLLDHVAICLPGNTLADYADFYLAAFGLARYSSEYVAVGDQAMDSIVVRSPSGGITFTLVAPDPAKQPGQLDQFLASNGGPGVQHLAFAVEQIIPVVTELRDQGVEFLSVPARYYDKLVERLPAFSTEIDDLRASSVLADRDEWGYLLQLFTRSPHERHTLFYEFIQREGSRGFGSANIRALYEAVERDRLTTS